MKKILIPLDFKLNSYDAVDYAINFFNLEQCHFYFFNTFTQDVEELNKVTLLQAGEDWFDEPKNQSEKSLGAIIQKYTSKDRENTHIFSAISKCSNLVEGIRKVIKEIGIDLVVLPRKKDSNDALGKYSKNTKRILENIRECPVMIIPTSAKLHKTPEFVLVSNFEEELPKDELQNWYDLVRLANGKIKIITLSAMDEMTSLQLSNQKRVGQLINEFSGQSVPIEYVNTIIDLKDYANYHSDYIICLIDGKPDLWRIFGITQSKITNLGPLQSTPLIALHR